jgi:tRNA threonylcarbamoyladenosine biosynthesis protein TsaE
MIEVFCPTPDDTRAAGRRLAAALGPGDVLQLAGSLGAGKTLFTAGLCEGLGVEEAVVSPSFVLVRRYVTGFLPVVHVDVYRLGSIHEFDDLDVFELGLDGVLVIEWGDAVEQVLPEDHLRVEFEIGDDESRTLRLIPGGSWVERGLETVT